MPDIVVGLLLFRQLQPGTSVQPSMAKLWHEAFTNRSVILLLGGVVIGMMYGPHQGSSVTDLYTNAFKAVLALFLLEMGLTAAGTLMPLPWRQWRLLLFALCAHRCCRCLESVRRSCSTCRWVRRLSSQA